VPNYFIPPPLGGRLNSCKMAANGEGEGILHLTFTREYIGFDCAARVSYTI